MTTSSLLSVSSRPTNQKQETSDRYILFQNLPLAFINKWLQLAILALTHIFDSCPCILPFELQKVAITLTARRIQKLNDNASPNEPFKRQALSDHNFCPSPAVPIIDLYRWSKLCLWACAIWSIFWGNADHLIPAFGRASSKLPACWNHILARGQGQALRDCRTSDWPKYHWHHSLIGKAKKNEQLAVEDDVPKRKKEASRKATDEGELCSCSLLQNLEDVL